MYLAEELPRCFPEKSPTPSGFLAIKSRRIRDPCLTIDPRPVSAKFVTRPRIESAHLRDLKFSRNPSKTGEVRMPHYEFFCHTCKKTFTKT